MSLTNLTSQSLRSILPLTEKREALIAKLEQVEAEIAKALDGTSVGNGRTVRKETLRVSATATVPGKRAKRGAVRELILAGLREAGDAGIAVKHLATQIGIKPQNIHVWMHTTGKKSGLVRALGNGVYRLEEALGLEPAKIEAPAPAAASAEPKPAKAPKAKRTAKAKPAAKAKAAPKAATPKPKAAPKAKAKKSAKKAS